MISQEAQDRICSEIAEGKSLRTILREDESGELPSMATIFRALAADEVFREQYTRAREAQADAIFDEILDIADDGKSDTYVDEDGNVRTDQEVVARSRIRIDARKWMAGKLRPKVYGDRVDVELGGKVSIIASSADEKL